MSRHSSKAQYYARINKTLRQYNITIEEYKANPYVLFERDVSFRNWVYNTFQPNTQFTWYGVKHVWSNLISPNMYNKIENENIEWSIALTNSQDFDNDEDLLHTSTDAENNQPFGTKKQKTSHEPQTPTSSKTDTEHTAESSNPVSEKPTIDSNKRKSSGEEESTSNKRTASENTRSNTSSGTATTTNLATSIKGTTAEQSKQANPTGEVEVDQSNQQQLQTVDGNAHNQRGTVQGEAGNLKIQKRLEQYGIIKVNMNYINKSISKIFIFVSDSKELCNDLIEIMEETYENGEVFTHKINIDDENIIAKLRGFEYIIAWKLPFNISYPTLASKLGNRYSKLITFTKNITDFENISQILETSVIVRFKNDTQLSTLAEAVEKAQQDYLKYNQPEEKKRKLANRF